ncbi:hypothetical protein GF327_01195 [Candidatus Woesearchaeota archaeon]|nr:hypothetical protein [Candidatus Woesearchaeota archaeon]
MENDTIGLTYELLFKIVRNERKNPDLQNIDKDIYEKIIDYVKNKDDIYHSSKDSVTQKEQEKIQTQIKNIKKLIKQLFNLREKKIIILAINTARTSSEIKIKDILPEEKKLYDILVEVLSEFRKSVLDHLLKGTYPEYVEKKKTRRKKGKQKSEQENKSNKIKVRFLDNIPKFVGPELEIYGPFEPNQIFFLPTQIAKILVDKKRAEKI